MVKLYFARHGQTDWNLQGKTQGENDIPLNALGKMQARSLQKTLPQLSLGQVISSSLSRARQTAEIAMAHLDCPLVLSDHWQEFSLAEQQLNRGDEPLLDKRLLQHFIELYQSGKNTLLISHGAVFDSLCRSLVMHPQKLGNACLLEIYRQEEHWRYQTLLPGYL